MGLVVCINKAKSIKKKIGRHTHTLFVARHTHCPQHVDNRMQLVNQARVAKSSVHEHKL